MVFKKTYPIDESPDLSEVVKDEVEFYAHCVTSLGVKLGVWEKVGKYPVMDNLDILFRATIDYGRKVGDSPVKISNNWYIWKINEDFRDVGKLEGDNKNGSSRFRGVSSICSFRVVHLWQGRSLQHIDFNEKQVSLAFLLGGTKNHI